jgi:hypothetical protein
MSDEMMQGEPRQAVQIEQDDLVIFGEDGRFYLVQKADYAEPTHELPASLMSAAEFLVGLGSVVSDVTAFEWDAAKDLMAKCACIVLNLASLRQLSEKEKGKPLTFLEGRGDKKSQASKKLSSDGKTINPELRLGKGDLVIFNEDRKFYWVKQHEYQSKSSELPSDMRGAPELMVKLGAVAADIPRIPTAGTACFLLNMACVRGGSSHAARILEENNLAERLREHGALPAARPLLEKRAEADRTFEEEKKEAIATVERWRKKLEPLDTRQYRRERRDLKRQARAARRGKSRLHILGGGAVGMVGVMKRSLLSVLGLEQRN